MGLGLGLGLGLDDLLNLDDLLAEERAAAALDEVERRVDGVGAVDGDVQLGEARLRRAERRQRDACMVRVRVSVSVGVRVRDACMADTQR